MLKRWIIGLSIALATAGVFGLTAGALAVPAKPSLDRPVIDLTNTLTDQQINELSGLVNSGRETKSYQLGVLMVPTLGVEAIEDYSIKVAREWGIGEKDKSNGVLLLIAKNDRRLRIEVGNGLEGDLTDAETGRIIASVITPEFKKGDYYGGIKNGIETIQARVEGKAEPHQSEMPSVGEFAEVIMFSLYFLLAGVSWLASVLARSKSWWVGGLVGGFFGGFVAFASGGALWAIGLLAGLVAGGLGLDYLVSRNYHERVTKRGESASWWAGGGTWGGGSSGGGSFGGGGFSGGGASGSW